jgi:hypothetical protein
MADQHIAIPYTKKDEAARIRREMFRLARKQGSVQVTLKRAA